MRPVHISGATMVAISGRSYPIISLGGVKIEEMLAKALLEGESSESCPCRISINIEPLKMGLSIGGEQAEAEQANNAKAPTAYPVEASD